MQKLDLGVDYDSEKTGAETTPEPATAEPVAAPKASSTATTPAAATPAQAKTETPSPATTTTVKSSSAMKKKTAPISIIIAVIAIVAGSATGVGAFKLQSQADPLVNTGPIQQVAGDSIKNGDVFGTTEEGNFKDSAEGYLQIGGLEGEGSHRLLRPGGDDQTVYLVSTVTELDKFDGMTIKVWGETYNGQKVGWLMDVGRVQIVETQGSAPSEE